ncbi:MAG: flagellar basal body-associated FliL family protein [Rhodocyclaceae bacterium]|nr:flagellar basal body-associated FliL family protein [Rhodocyclaceae bacterium]
MAEAKKPDAAAEEPKKKSKLPLILVIAVVVLALAGGGAFFLLKKKSADAEDEEAAEEAPAKTAKAKKKKAPEAPPAFTKLDPFVVKLQSEGQEAYVQAVPELKIIEAPVAEQIKQYMPEIRHKVLLLLAAKKASELSTPEGMQVLANQIREAINATLDNRKVDPAREKQDTDREGPVTAVFFSSLIVQ